MATSSAESAPESTPEVEPGESASGDAATGDTTAGGTTSPAGASAESSTPDAEHATAPQPAVVFVTAPQPPKKRGARGVGALVALLSAGVFAVVYAVLVALFAMTVRGNSLQEVVSSLSAPAYWLPVIVFFLAYLLLVIIVNRAGWWAHVLGGFFVAVIVWISFVGAEIIAVGAFGGSTADVTAIVVQQLTNPLGFAAAIAAREVPIWVGGIVAKRGRTARARNVEARASYERELAEHRATVNDTTAV
ncbi:hypothetical protein [Microcella sp.]|uniref:hypothetical protein n=1 Tax=Microcella sp. TaxID=1913979 RepID=UPI00299F5CC5|nr:hypothetical protein [Microcella sp.]MDX2024740.1 hypothetical protein [Microcella sp.]